MEKFEINGGIYYHPNLKITYQDKPFYTHEYIYAIVDRNKCPKLDNSQMNRFIANYNYFIDHYEPEFIKYREGLFKKYNARQINYEQIGKIVDQQKRIIKKITSLVGYAEKGLIYFDFIAYSKYRGYDKFFNHPNLIEREIDAIIYYCCL